MPRVPVVPFVVTAVALSLSIVSAALAQPRAATPPLPTVPYEWFRVEDANYVEAHKWLNLGCAGLSGDAQKQCAAARDRVAALMTSAQIADAQKLAREWSAVAPPGR